MRSTVKVAMVGRPNDYGRRSAERHAELGLEARGRVRIDQQTRRHRIHFDLDCFDAVGRNLVTLDEIEQHVQRRMRGGARRVELHGDTGLENLPSPVEVARCRAQRRGRMLTVHRHKISLRAVDRVLARDESLLRQPRGQDTVPGSESRV